MHWSSHLYFLKEMTRINALLICSTKELQMVKINLMDQSGKTRQEDFRENHTLWKSAVINLSLKGAWIFSFISTIILTQK